MASDRWRETARHRGYRDFVRVVRDRPFLFLLGTTGAATLVWFLTRRLGPTAWELDDPTAVVDLALLAGGAVLFAALVAITQLSLAPLRQLHEIRQAFSDQLETGTKLWDASSVAINSIQVGPDLYIDVSNHGPTTQLVAELLSLKGVEEQLAPSASIAWYQHSESQLSVPTRATRRLHLATIRGGSRLLLHLSNGDQLHYLTHRLGDEPLRLTATVSIRPDGDGVAVAAEFDANFHLPK